MRVLFITEQFPHPLDNGGNLRSFHIIRELAREHEVHLLSLDEGQTLDLLHGMGGGTGTDRASGPAPDSSEDQPPQGEDPDDR